MPLYKVTNTGMPIDATLTFMQENYPNNFTAYPEHPWTWLIDTGPFTDRFGTSKFAIDTSTDAFVQFFSRDVTRRKWIDLQDRRVLAALYYLAGRNVPGIGSLVPALITVEQAVLIYDTPVLPEENMALRKLYFS